MKTLPLLLVAFFLNLIALYNLKNEVAASPTINELSMPEECGQAAYQDTDGLVIIEAENLLLNNVNWSVKTGFDDFTGDGYLSWNGNNNFNRPGIGLITTKINITKTGRYRFQWRSRIGVGTNSTEHNDSWLRFPDASDFYGEKNGARVFPRGTGKSPNPEGSSADGWFKIYLSGSTTWTWRTSTSDNDPHDIYVEFDTPGIYTMELSGRSKDHLIDRISLSNGATDPLNLDNEETSCTGDTASISNADLNYFKMFPNPAEDFINIEMNPGNVSNTIMIVDLKGIEVLRTEISNLQMQFDISTLASGFYFITTDKGISKTFVKK